MGIPLRVLLIEDSLADAELTLIELRLGGFDPIYERVDTPEATKAALGKGDWDIILSDYVMPRFSGPAALRLVQEMDIDLPFIMVTGQVGEETAIDAVKAGANNYVLKGNLMRMVPAVQRELRDAEVRRERKRAEEERGKLLQELVVARRELEARVSERTAELAGANEALQVENGERRRVEAKIRHQNTVLEGVNRILQGALTASSEEALGRACLAVAEEVTESKFGFIGEINHEGRLDDIAISDPGWNYCRMEPDASHRLVPTGFKVHGIYGRVLLDGKGLFTNDPASHPDSIGVPEGHPPLKAFLGVPLIHREKTVGMVGVGNREGGYRNEDLEALQALAPAIVQAFMRKRAEEALRASEAKYRNLFMNMTEEVHFWKLVRNEEGRIKTWRLVDANPPALKSWGKTLAEIEGKTADEIFGPGATDHYMPVVQKIMTEGVPYSFEDYFPNLDKYFRFTSVPLGDYFITTGADITSIRKANEALRESEARLRRLYESGMIGVLHFDMDGSITDANDKFMEMVGYTREDLQAGLISWAQMTPPEYGALDEKAVAELKASGVDAPYEKEYIRKDGSRVSILIGAATYDEARHRGIAFVLDITERKRAEEERERLLTEGQRRAAELEAVLDNMADAVYVSDAEGNPILVNDAGVRLLGLASPQEARRALKESVELFRMRRLDGKPISREDLPLARALRGETVMLDDEIIYNLLTKKDVYVRVNASPIRNKQRQIGGSVAVFRDITDLQS